MKIICKYIKIKINKYIKIEINVFRNENFTPS